MPRRAAIAGIAAALVSIVPSASVAHAQDLDCGDFRFQEEAQAVFEQDRTDPHRLDEEQGPDDGIACEALPRRTAISATSTARSPSPVPTRGARTGVGGVSAPGPTGRDIGIGVTLAAAGVLAAAGYALLRRRRNC
jgi:hypothetical protein